MAISSGAAAFKLQFQISPIMLTGGIAGAIPGGVLPVLTLANILGGGLTDVGAAADAALDSFFAYFQPLPGSTMIDQQIGMYPFANQNVAANATIQEPWAVSMLMICPAGRGGGYATKFALMQAMQSAFDNHNKSGGLYNVMTPSFVYTDTVMTAMTDVSSSSTKQVQNAYKLDFLKPLVTLAAAAGAQSALMSAVTNGTPTTGALSGATGLTGTTIGGASPTFVPNTANQGGAGVSSGVPLLN